MIYWHCRCVWLISIRFPARITSSVSSRSLIVFRSQNSRLTQKWCQKRIFGIWLLRCEWTNYRASTTTSVMKKKNSTTLLTIPFEESFNWMRWDNRASVPMMPKITRRLQGTHHRKRLKTRLLIQSQSDLRPIRRDYFVSRNYWALPKSQV